MFSISPHIAVTHASASLAVSDQHVPAGHRVERVQEERRTGMIIQEDSFEHASSSFFDRQLSPHHDEDDRAG